MTRAILQLTSLISTTRQLPGTPLLWKRLLTITCAALTTCAHAHADDPFTLTSHHDTVIGQVRYARAHRSETLIDVARRYALGYDQILKTNPSLNRWIPGETQKVLIADRYILPDAPRRGIVLNVAELRLYYYLIQHPDGGQPVFTFPVSLGRMDWRTPLGATTIIRKERNPAWRPPRSIREEHAAEGDYLPEVIPGGHPENPLGGHALYLGLPSYLIHGVDARKAYGIGMRVTHGCVRMYPEHIELLYRVVPIGTRVVLVDQPVKIGWEEDKLYLEVHAPFEEDGDTQPRVSVRDVMEMISQRVGGAASVDPSFVRRVVERGDGIPAVIATRHDRRYLR